MNLESLNSMSIYFIMIDRFYCQGHPVDLQKGEFNPKDNKYFQGGNLAGITAKLPYISKMGFSAIWITPPVYNQWINPTTETRGYHGYWAYNFEQVDPHFGTLDDYKNLVKEAHALGLYVFQDIVVGHTGDFFTVNYVYTVTEETLDACEKNNVPGEFRKSLEEIIDKEFVGIDEFRARIRKALPGKAYEQYGSLVWEHAGEKFIPELSWTQNVGSVPGPCPDDDVFKMNDATNQQHLEAAVYNFTPNIYEFNSRKQDLTYSVAGLFNTSKFSMFYNFPGNCCFKQIFSSESTPSTADFSDYLVLPPKSYYVFKREAKSVPSRPPFKMFLSELEDAVYQKQVSLSFMVEHLPQNYHVYLLVDRNFEHKMPISSHEKGKFNLDTEKLANGNHDLELLLETTTGEYMISNEIEIKVENSYHLYKAFKVPQANRQGISGNVKPPLSWPSGVLNFNEINILTKGKDLSIQLVMEALSSNWNPPNQFDHVYFHIFFAFPGQADKAKSDLPMLNYAYPGFFWNYGFYLYGWGQKTFNSADSSFDHYGSPVEGHISHVVDEQSRMITINISNDFFDSINHIAGTKILLTSWDGDGIERLRDVSNQRREFGFYTSDPHP